MAKGYTLGRLKAFDTSMLKAFRYYEREFSLHRAERFEDAVYECIEIIARNPHTFPKSDIKIFEQGLFHVFLIWFYIELMRTKSKFSLPESLDSPKIG